MARTQAPQEVLNFVQQVVDALTNKNYEELTRLGKMLDNGHLSNYIADHKFTEKIDSKLIPEKVTRFDKRSGLARALLNLHQRYGEDRGEIVVPAHTEKRKYAYIGIVFKPENMAIDVNRKIIKPLGNLNYTFSKESMEGERRGDPVIYQRTIYKKANQLPKGTKSGTRTIPHPDYSPHNPKTWNIPSITVPTGEMKEYTRRGFEVTYLERDVSARYTNRIAGEDLPIPKPKTDTTPSEIKFFEKFKESKSFKKNSMRGNKMKKVKVTRKQLVGEVQKIIESNGGTINIGTTTGSGALPANYMILEDPSAYEAVLLSLQTKGGTDFGNALENLFDQAIANSTNLGMTPLNDEVVKGLDFADGMGEMTTVSGPNNNIYLISYKATGRVGSTDAANTSIENLGNNQWVKFFQCVKKIHEEGVTTIGNPCCPALLGATINLPATRAIRFAGIVWECVLVYDPRGHVHAKVIPAEPIVQGVPGETQSVDVTDTSGGLTGYTVRGRSAPVPLDDEFVEVVNMPANDRKISISDKTNAPVVVERVSGDSQNPSTVYQSELDYLTNPVTQGNINTPGFTPGNIRPIQRVTHTPSSSKSTKSFKSNFLGGSAVEQRIFFVLSPDKRKTELAMKDRQLLLGFQNDILAGLFITMNGTIVRDTIDIFDRLLKTMGQPGVIGTGPDQESSEAAAKRNFQKVEKQIESQLEQLRIQLGQEITPDRTFGGPAVELIVEAHSLFLDACREVIQRTPVGTYTTNLGYAFEQFGVALDKVEQAFQTFFGLPQAQDAQEDPELLPEGLRDTLRSIIGTARDAGSAVIDIARSLAVFVKKALSTFKTIVSLMKQHGNPELNKIIAQQLVNGMQQLLNSVRGGSISENALYESILLDLMEASAKKQRAVKQPKKIKLTKRSLNKMLRESYHPDLHVSIRLVLFSFPTTLDDLHDELALDPYYGDNPYFYQDLKDEIEELMAAGHVVINDDQELRYIDF